MTPHRILAQAPSQAITAAGGGLAGFVASAFADVHAFVILAAAAALAHTISGLGRAYLDPGQKIEGAKFARGFVTKIMSALIVPLAAMLDTALYRLGIEAAGSGWLPDWIVSVTTMPFTAAALLALTATWAADTLANIKHARALPRFTAPFFKLPPGSLDALTDQDRDDLQAWLEQRRSTAAAGPDPGGGAP
jgi:hypothetical protein